jgi:hypothetical protein
VIGAVYLTSHCHKAVSVANMESLRYSRIHTDEDIEIAQTSGADTDDFEEKFQHQSLPLRRHRNRSPVLWKISSIVLSVLCVTLLVDKKLSNPALGTYEHGFSTDLTAARPFINLKKHQFTGGLDFYAENGTVFRAHNSADGREYVGPPSPAIDEAWKYLLDGLTVKLPKSNPGNLKDIGYEQPDFPGYLTTTLDVHHTLHCVNVVRKGLYPDYYQDKHNTPAAAQLHLEHCLDYVRQSVMCHGDLTPVRLFYHEQLEREVADFETWHTCRDYSVIRDWAVENVVPPPADQDD